MQVAKPKKFLGSHRAVEAPEGDANAIQFECAHMTRNRMRTAWPPIHSHELRRPDVARGADGGVAEVVDG